MDGSASVTGLSDPVRGSTGPAAAAQPAPAGSEDLDPQLAAGLDETLPPQEFAETRLRVSPAVQVDGGVRVTMQVGPWMTGPDGAAAVGSLGVLLDDALGLAVFFARPAGTHSVTSEISVDMVAQPPWSGPELVANARLLHHDGGSGLSRCEVRDGAGSLVAVGMARCRSIPIESITRVKYGPRRAPAPHSSLLEALDLAAPSASSADPADPAGLAGLLERTGDGSAALVVPPTQLYKNGGGTVHGGVLFCLTELAVHALADPAVPEETISVRMNYLRPALLEHPVTYTAETVYRGRAVAVYRVTSSGPAGKPYTVATITRSRRPRTSS